MVVSPKCLSQSCFTIIVGACMLGVSARAEAQVPSRVDPQVLSRARNACDAAAQRAGYRVVRRDRENVNGRSYDLPLRVAYGTTEGDVTCRYDIDRGLANVPPYEGGRAFGRRGSGAYNQAQTMCENFVNQRRGYRVVSVGTPVQHGRNLWDVPVTVQRNGRRQSTMTCRYNAASNKLSLR
jgi:hypothetical protein